MKHVYDINKGGHDSNYKDKRTLVTNEFYLPPENCFSPQGDIWSLGILLHEVLTGLLPCNEKTGYF